MINELRDISTEVWHLLKRCLEDIQGTDEWWQGIIDEADQINKKHEGTPFEAYTRGYVQVALAEITRAYKEGKHE